MHRWFDEYSLTAPGAANHVLSLLARILNHAVACGHLRTNPARGIRRNPRPKLTRFLSREEVSRLHRVLARHARARPSRARQADVIRLLLLTGCRKSEILTLRWQDVDGNTINLGDAKTGPRRVFLNAPARAVLERQPRSNCAYVFPSPRNRGSRFRDTCRSGTRCAGKPGSRTQEFMIFDTRSRATPCCGASRSRSSRACSATSGPA